MGLKLGLLHELQNIAWGCSTAWCWGRHDWIL